MSYVGEQWRNSAAAAQTVNFSYRIGAGLGDALTDFTTGGTAVPALNFTSPITGGSAGALDGNVSANRVAIAGTISGLSLAPGQEILLRWEDVDHSGSDHGLAIDDLAIVASGGAPTPTLSIDDVSVTEGDSGTVTATFTVTVSTPSHPGVTFDIATADGAGSNAATLADLDYVQHVETGVFIPPGSTTYAFTVAVNGDFNVEPDETFLVQLSNVSGATLATGTGTGTIVNDDVPPPAASDVVISQVYGGGGNSGATITNDFIELFNRGSATVSVSGWSVQYASSAGTTWQSTPIAGSIPPGGYFLVQEAAGSGGTVPLPTPDAVGGISMAAASGKIALAPGTAALSGACPAAGLLDLVGYGTANCYEGAGASGVLSNTTAALRKRGGCFDSDNNNVDFSTGAPGPRNSSSPLHSCVATPMAIHDIQGPGLTTPVYGDYVSTTGIVTGVKINGFFIQAPNAAWDADPFTSEGLFAFTGALPAVAVGDFVTASGTASEYFDLTQIESSLPGDVLVGSSGNALPAPIALTPAVLDPAGTPWQLEPLEGMRVSAASVTTVAPSDAFGEVSTVLTGVSRPLREPGISVLEPVPPDSVVRCAGLLHPALRRKPGAVRRRQRRPRRRHRGCRHVQRRDDGPDGSARLCLRRLHAAARARAVDHVQHERRAGAGIRAGRLHRGRLQHRELHGRRHAAPEGGAGHPPADAVPRRRRDHRDSRSADAAGAGRGDQRADGGGRRPGSAVPGQAGSGAGGGTQNVGFLVKTSRVRIDSVTQEQGTDTYVDPPPARPRSCTIARRSSCARRWIRTASSRIRSSLS